MNQNRQLTSEEKKVVGTYEGKVGANTFRYVLLKDGRGMSEDSSLPIIEDNFKWYIVDNELHFKHPNNVVYIYRINPDNSITTIAYINNGKRKYYRKEIQHTCKIIN